MSKSVKIKEVDIIPFKIKNRKAFLKHEQAPQDFKEYNDYLKYFDRQAQRCIQGYWGKDIDKDGNGGYRYMSGNLYFYINLTKIRREGAEGTQPTINPDLRDVDWYIAYALLACDGFSGFSKDTEYTCCRAIGKLQRGEKLSVKEKITIERNKDTLTKPNGEYKTYIEAREYLYQTFARPMGSPMYLNECLNLMLLTARGQGKSYTIANAVIVYDYIFGRSRKFSDWTTRKSTTTTIVGAAIKEKSTELLSKATLSISSFEKGIGFTNKLREWRNIPEEDPCVGYFHKPQVGSALKGEIHDNPTESGTKVAEENSNKIIHVVYAAGKESAGAGQRGKCIIEEVGLLTNFKKVHSENRGTQIQETKNFYSIYIGTGGDIKKIKEVQDAFYAPNAYECLGFPNIFDNKSAEIGMFIPAYYAKIYNKDENGNTLLQQAIQDEEEERLKKLNEDEESYEGHVRSFPVVPREMFRKMEGGRFKVYKAEKRIDFLDSGEWLKKVSIGTLQPIVNGTTSWVEDIKGELNPIIRLGDENEKRFATDKRSAILVYEHPKEYRPKIDSGEKPLYLVIYDAVANDEKGTSLAAIQVYKRFDITHPNTMQHTLVAEWYGRHEDLNETHDLAMRLAYYYDARLLPETNISECLRYYRLQYRSTHLMYLEDEPLLDEKGKMSPRKSGKKGFRVLPNMKPELEQYAEKLFEQKVGREDKLDNNIYTSEDITFVDNLWSLRTLDELIAYNRAENFDAMSCIFLLSVWLECNFSNPLEEVNQTPKKESNINYEKFMAYKKLAEIEQSYDPAHNW